MFIFYIIDKIFIFYITAWPLQIVAHFLYTDFLVWCLPPLPSTVLDSVNMDGSQHTEYNENSCWTELAAVGWRSLRAKPSQLFFNHRHKANKQGHHYFISPEVLKPTWINSLPHIKMTSIGQHLNIFSMLLMGWSNKILSPVSKLSVMSLSSNEFSPSLHKSECRRGTPEDWERCGEI